MVEGPADSVPVYVTPSGVGKLSGSFVTTEPWEGGGDSHVAVGAPSSSLSLSPSLQAASSAVMASATARILRIRPPPLPGLPDRGKRRRERVVLHRRVR